MNKLYKYLPFDIKIRQEDYGFQQLTPYVLHALSENPEIEVKPVLRSFEDLTKELLLTKAAAEIINKIEGDYVFVDEELTDFELKCLVNNSVELLTEKTLDFLRSMRINVDFKEGEYIKLGE